MRFILIAFIIIVVATTIAFFYSGKSPFKSSLPDKSESLKEEATFKTQQNYPSKQATGKQPLPQSIGPAAVIKPLKTFSLIDTYIATGPKEGKIIEETNEVVFEFGAKVFTATGKNRVVFETKIKGDGEWKKTFSNRKVIKFAPGPKEYTFLVRARIKDLVDPTPASRTFKINISPHFGKLKISAIRAKTNNHPSLITLSSRLEKGEKINITNWRIKGRRGEITIPQGLEKYQSQSTPGNIIIRKYDKIYLVGAPNPLGKNRNFRLNKCSGYLLNYHKFYPSFSKSCPKPPLEEISHLSSFCQEFIRHLSRCELPNYSNNLRVATNSKCTSYIRNNFNYSSCLKNHYRDKNFFKSRWYIYVSSDIVDKLHDTLYLYDQNGLVVDKYIY